VANTWSGDAQGWVAEQAIGDGCKEKDTDAIGGIAAPFWKAQAFRSQSCRWELTEWNRQGVQSHGSAPPAPKLGEYSTMDSDRRS